MDQSHGSVARDGTSWLALLLTSVVSWRPGPSCCSAITDPRYCGHLSNGFFQLKFCGHSASRKVRQSSLSSAVTLVELDIKGKGGESVLRS
jgi:hypothetical protein